MIFSDEEIAINWSENRKKHPPKNETTLIEVNELLTTICCAHSYDFNLKQKRSNRHLNIQIQLQQTLPRASNCQSFLNCLVHYEGLRYITKYKMSFLIDISIFAQDKRKWFTGQNSRFKHTARTVVDKNFMRYEIYSDDSTKSRVIFFLPRTYCTL